MAQFSITSTNTNVDIHKLKLELETTPIVSCRVISIKPNNTGVVILIDADNTTSQAQIDQLKTLIDNHNNTQRRRILVHDLPDGPGSASNSDYVDSKATNFLDDAKQYTDDKIADLVNSAPATLDTLNELADALGSDPNFATTVSNRIGTAENRIADLEARPSVTNLDAISDVEINTPINNQALQYVDGIWKNKTLAEVALTNQYSDLTNKPVLAAVATSGSYNDLNNKPQLAEVATSGSYNDLNNKPTLFSGSYNDLTDVPPMSSGIPSGLLSPFAGTSAPDGWLICDGSAISRTAYSTLFDVVGTTYGPGDGSTTFNIPDLRSRVPVGRGTTINTTLGSTDNLNESDRNLTHNHSVTVAGHFHDMSGAGSTLSTDISHTHNNSSVTGTVTIGTYDLSHSHGGTTGNDSPDHTHSGTTGSMNSNVSHGHTINDPSHIHEQTINANPGFGNGLWPYHSGIRLDYVGDAGSPAIAYPSGTATVSSATGITVNSTDINHTHNFSTGGRSAFHQHAFSTNSTTMTNAGNSLNHNHGATPNLTATGQTLGTYNVAPVGKIGKVTGGVDGNTDQTVTSTNTRGVNYVIMNYIIKT